MARILVTGGCGFLGSWVVDALVRDGHAVTVLDRAIRADGLELVRSGLSRLVETRGGDVTNLEDMTAALDGMDRVVHLAGLMTVDCRADPLRGARVNVLGGLTVFEAARVQGLSLVAHVSTAGVYGPDDANHPWPESHYGAFKLAMEGCARAYWRDHGLPSVAFRPTIVYGPGEGSGISAGPSIACRAAIEGRPAEILFTGSIGFVHVADVARAFARAMRLVDPIGAEVHDLPGDPSSVADFGEALRDAVPGAEVSLSGSPLAIAPVIPPDGAGWGHPVTPVAEGIRKTLAHWRALGDIPQHGAMTPGGSGP
jgi:nucleoside-diphosphate-sugar epimerase